MTVQLPVRVSPEYGEAFESLCRRLAEANGISPTELIKHCQRASAGVASRVEAVAHAIDLDPNELEHLTLAAAQGGARRANAWRLRATVWYCPECSSRGVTDALRGFAVQFLCLRCNTFLSRADGLLGHSTTCSVNDFHRIQREIISAFANRAHAAISKRLRRLGPLTRAVGKHLVHSSPETIQSILFRVDGVGRVWNESTFGLPEDPRLFAEAVHVAWELAAHDDVQLWAINALGHGRRSTPLRPVYGGRQSPVLSRVNASGPRWEIYGPEQVLQVGLRIHELRSAWGLRAAQVPHEQLHLGQGLVLSNFERSWLEGMYGVLRDWLTELEHADAQLAEPRRTLACPALRAPHFRDFPFAADNLAMRICNLSQPDAMEFLGGLIALAESLI